MNRFTLAALAALLGQLPKPPVWRHCVTTPENLERLRHDPRLGPWTVPGCGVEMHAKPGQVAEAWLFEEDKILRQYLASELTEMDLLDIMRSGACQPLQ